MIEPQDPHRDDSAWTGPLIFFGLFLVLMASGVIRAMAAGRL